MDIIQPEDLPKDNPIDNPIFVEQKKTIRPCKWGIGCTSGNGNVYVNEDLKKYNPQIYQAVLNHELGHDLGAYNTNDLQADLLDNFLTLNEKLKFCVKYPKGFFHFSPIHIIKVPKEWKEDCKYEVMVSPWGLFQYGAEIAVIVFVLKVTGVI